MRLANGRLSRRVLVLALCVGPWGCAHTPPPHLPQSPSEELRAQLGTIGVSNSVAGSTPAITAPTSGKRAGAVKGAALGFASGAKPGLYVTVGVARGCGGGGGGLRVAAACAFVMLGGLGLAATGGTLGALGGSVYGAVTADSASRVSAAESALASAVVDFDLPRQLRDDVLDAVRSRSAQTFIALEDTPMSELVDATDSRVMAAEGITTILEIRVSRIGLAGKWGINPDVALSMTARVRLVRTDDGAELYGDSLDYVGTTGHKFAAWADDGGLALAFKEELGVASRRLADDIARLLFPADPVPDVAPTAPAVELLVLGIDRSWRSA